MMNKFDKFRQITNEMVELCEKKDKDYGQSTHDTFVKYGSVSYLVRI